MRIRRGSGVAGLIGTELCVLKRRLVEEGLMGTTKYFGDQDSPWLLVMVADDLDGFLYEHTAFHELGHIAAGHFPPAGCPERSWSGTPSCAKRRPTCAPVMPCWPAARPGSRSKKTTSTGSGEQGTAPAGDLAVVVVALACLISLIVYRARRPRDWPPAFRAAAALCLIVALAFASRVGAARRSEHLVYRKGVVRVEYSRAR